MSRRTLILEYMDTVYTPTSHESARYHFSKVPNYIAPGIAKINYDELVAMGVRHLVFDVDNTLVSFGDSHIESYIVSVIDDLVRSARFESIILASNSRRNLDWLAGELQLPVVQPKLLSMKPFPWFYRRIMRRLGTDKPSSVAMIGDKLIQDIWGANYVGMTSLLVRPLGRDNLWDQLVRTRPRERRLLRRLLPQHIERWF